MVDPVEQRINIMDERLNRQELRLDNVISQLSELETRYGVLMNVASEVSSIKRKNDQIYDTISNLTTNMKTTQDQIFKTDVINGKIYELVEDFIKEHKNDGVLIIEKIKKTIKKALIWLIPSLMLGVCLILILFYNVIK